MLISSAMKKDIPKTIVIVGSRGSGKTSLFNALHRRVHKREGYPQSSDCSVTLNADGIEVRTVIFDTDSPEEFFDVRRVTYLTADVVLLLVGLDDRQSLVEAEGKWHPEVRYYGPENVPVLLVGNKCDLRGRDDGELVTASEGLAAAQRISAYAYLECSADTGTGVLAVFLKAAKAAHLPKKKKRSKCHII